LKLTIEAERERDIEPSRRPAQELGDLGWLEERKTGASKLCMSLLKFARKGERKGGGRKLGKRERNNTETLTRLKGGTGC